MNPADRHPKYRELYSEVKGLFDKTTHFRHGPFDETYYTMRVYECAKEVIKRMKGKVCVERVLVAAILHDVGKVKLCPSKMFKRDRMAEDISEEWHKHARLGVPIARRLLKKQGHSEEFITDVCYLIEQHDLRGDAIKGKTLELQVLQDADLIADIGFAGFIRPFLFSGKFNGQSIIDSIAFVKKDDRTKEGSELNLAVSRAIARREMRIQRALIREIAKEVESDLL